MFRPTITDMHDKYCGNRYDIYLIQSQYTKVAAFGRHHKRGGVAFGRATSLVVSFVLALNSSSPVVLHVPSPFVQCALARKRGPGAPCPPGGSSGGAFGPPRAAGGFGQTSCRSDFLSGLNL